jgi:hypothetical protein
MIKKIVSIVLVLLVLVAAVACGSEEEQITGQELIDGTLASIENQETCRYEESKSFTMSGTFDDEYAEVDYSTDVSGVIDMVAQEMQLDTTMSTEVRALTQAKETIAAKEYILGDMAYVGLVREGLPVEWVKGDVSGDFWESLDCMSSQIALIRGGEAVILGTEKVKGVDCYIAEISPDMDELLEYMGSQLQQEYLFVELTEDSISNYSQKGWFAKNTFFLMKSYQEFDAKIDIYGDEATYHFIIDTLFYDWNEPVSIELPPEAEEAEYVGPLDI